MDPRRVPIVRLDFLAGPIWRLHVADALVITSVEVGRARGFSGSFHTGLILGRDRDVVRVVELPIGVGAIARTRLRKWPLFASIGLTAGVFVHRAAIDDRVIHRVDPDFRLPIRLAWTIATVGISLALEQGYSVRNRSYEQRGAQVWARHAYRVGFVLGLHSDIGLSRATMGRAGRRSRSRR
ncbi:MAG: hypothetical protein IAG13_06615 [Deltaproteobacteria bacterium]|nr:hypothetical protein [Nannocystaceae bacterium]